MHKKSDYFYFCDGYLLPITPITQTTTNYVESSWCRAKIRNKK